MVSMLEPARSVGQDRVATYAVLLAASLLTACSTGSAPERAVMEPAVTEVDGVRVVENHGPQWGEGEGWRISAEPVLTLGVDAGDREQMFTSYPRPVRLDGGVIVVGDWGSKELRAFDAEGRHLWTAGGMGQGPGEFESIGYVVAAGGGRIVVTDGYKDRVTVFSSDGELVGTFDPVAQDDPRFYPTPTIEAAFPDGSLLATGAVRDGSVGVAAGERAWRPAGTWRYSAAGDEVQLLGVFDFYETIGESHGMPVPFEARSWVRPHASGFYFVHGRQSTVEDYAFDGTLRARFVLPREAVPVTDEDRERWLQKSLDNYEEAGQEFAPERRDGMVYPATMPTWRNVEVDRDGNIWVERVGLQHVRPLYWGTDMNSDPFFPVTDSVWDVISADGVWLGAVELLPDRTVIEIGNDWVLMTGEDDAAVPHVYLYELIKN